MRTDPQDHDADITCARIAARQQGIVRRQQAIDAGLSSQAIYRRVQRGVWTRVLPTTFLIGPGRSEWHQRLSALAQWSRGLASHGSAAALLALDGFDAEPLEVTCARRLVCPWPHAVVHYTVSLPADSIEIMGIPATSATRTLVDIASTADPDRVELALEDALRRKLTSPPRLRWALSTQGARGRAGAKVLRSLVDALDGSRRVTESGFETRLYQLLRKEGLTLPEKQFEIVTGGRRLARPDFAYPDKKLVIEAVSYKWHSGRHAWGHDQTRLNQLAAAGWRVLHVTWDDLKNRPEKVIRQIAQALGYHGLLD